MGGIGLLRSELAERDADVIRELDASAEASTRRLDQVLLRRFEYRASGLGLDGPGGPSSGPQTSSTGWTLRTPPSGLVAAVVIFGLTVLGAAAVVASGDRKPPAPGSAAVMPNGPGTASDETDGGSSPESTTSVPILVDADVSLSGPEATSTVTEANIAPVTSATVELESSQPTVTQTTVTQTTVTQTTVTQTTVTQTTVAPADAPVLSVEVAENPAEPPQPTGQPCVGDGVLPGEPTAVGTSDIDLDGDGLSDSVLLYASGEGPVFVAAFGAGGVTAVELPEKPVGTLTDLARVVTVHSGDAGRQLVVVVDDLDDGATWWTIVVAIDGCTPVVLPIEVESGAFSGVSFTEGSERFGLLCADDQPAQPLVVVDVESNAYGLSFDESNFELVVNGEGNPSTPGCWQ